MNGRLKAILLIFGLGFSNLGNWIYFVAINIMVLNITGSATALAGLFVIRPIAMLVTNFWSGSIIDRINVRKLMIFVDVIRGILIGLILFAPSLIVIYALMFVINLFGSFFGPSSSVYITKLIPTEKRQRFNSLISMTNSSAFLLGPAISGLLIMTVGVHFCIVFNAISFIVCAFIIFLLPDVENNSDHARGKISFHLLASDLRTVVKFAKSSTFFISIYILFQAAALIGYAIDSQEAAFIKMVLKLSDMDYGNIISITGVGSLLGAFLAALTSQKISYRWFMSYGILLTTFFYILFYASSSFMTAALSFALLGFFMSFASAGYAACFQNHVPPEMMGRFASIADMIQGTIQIMITLLVGLLADLISLRLSCLLFAGFACLLCILLCLKMLAPSSKSENGARKPA
ncbi:MFS transporter [Paenibacillus elgii]|uniref:MFS transporter n=1 Tax=Paenibacillus elgii TaxID=189691 RepID=UPI000248CE92|nr:MFS transporter [Paenibacillus elgii]